MLPLLSRRQRNPPLPPSPVQHSSTTPIPPTIPSRRSARPHRRNPAYSANATTPPLYEADRVRAAAIRAWAGIPPAKIVTIVDPPNASHSIHPHAASVKLSDAFALDGRNRPLTYRATRTSPDLNLWRIEESNEIIRLIETTATMDWFDFRLKPTNRTASYYNPQVKVKVAPDGTLHRRVRGTYGGNVTDYSGLRASWTADMQTVKLLLNATVSEGANLCTLDIKDFYLGSDLEHDEYMWLTRAQVPPDLVERYGSRIIWSGDKTLVRIKKGLYGLPQAGRLAHDKLTKLLAKHGYSTTNTPCLFQHATNGISFTLVVDDFLIKWQDRKTLEHLFSAIREEYKFDVDEEATKYIGMTLAYDKVKRTITLSMPGYVAAALRRFNVVPAPKPTHSPAKFDPILYGQPIQYATRDTSPPVSESEATFIREVIGVFLYYARAVDPTMLPTLSKLSLGQGVPTRCSPPLSPIRRHLPRCCYPIPPQ